MKRQIVVVSKAAGSPAAGVLRAGTRRIPCRLGRAGISRLKREGDGATPAGRLRPLAVLYRRDRLPRPVTSLPLHAIRPDEGWCDDPADRNYNRAVRLPYPARHERLWRDDRLYDVVVVLDWNTAPAVPNRGSAIFLHLAGERRGPTEGCVAIDAAAMRWLLRAIGPAARIDIG